MSEAGCGMLGPTLEKLSSDDNDIRTSTDPSMTNNAVNATYQNTNMNRASTRAANLANAATLNLRTKRRITSVLTQIPCTYIACFCSLLMGSPPPFRYGAHICMANSMLFFFVSDEATCRPTASATLPVA